MSYHLSNRLFKDFEKLFESRDNYDIIIKVGKSENQESFQGHSLILGLRSSYFQIAFSNNWAKKQDDGKYIFEKSNISPKVFKTILKYIYTGKIDYTQYETNEILDLLVASDELLLDELVEHIQRYLIEKHNDFLEKNIIQVLQCIHHYETCKNLYNNCINLICLNPKILFDSENFNVLDENVLIRILKRDDLYMKAFDVWKKVIQWGISKSSSKLPEKIEDWTDENFGLLSETLKDCITLIRYHDMSSDEFSDSVDKKIIPKPLLAYLENSFNSMQNKITFSKIKLTRNIDSEIIIYKNATQIEKWINIQDQILESTSLIYRWNLLYRASRDGYTVNYFYKQCMDKGACVVVVKILYQNKVIGAYNPIGWFNTVNEFSIIKNSFLYSFENLRNGIVCREKQDRSQTINQSKTLGPSFGILDFIISNNCNRDSSKCNPGTFYEKNFNIGDFIVEDYEVFQLIK